MGIISDLFGGGGDFSSAVVGSDVAKAVPLAPPIPDVVQPSAPQIQQARQAAQQRSTFLGRTRGGTLVRRARSVASTAEVEPDRRS
jgi:hypothetical protein